MPGWKRWIVSWGWDTILVVFMIPVVLVGVVAAIALAVVIAGVASAIRLTGDAAGPLTLMAGLSCLAVLFVVPVLLVRRLRRAFPAAWFAAPADAPQPVRRSRTAILSDVSRLDARFAPGHSAVRQGTPEEPDR